MEKRRDILISVLLLVAAVCFGLGIALPLVHLEKLYFFSETPSLLQLTGGLWQEGNLFIAVLVALFSLLFPLIKLAVIFHSASAQTGDAPPAWSSHLAKWSMMDVLLVALVIFAAKTSGIATAAAQSGIWFYGLSVLSGAAAAGLIKRRKQNAAQGE